MVAGVLLRPGDNTRSGDALAAVGASPETERLIGKGVLSWEGLKRRVPVADVIKRIGDCDRAIDLDAIQDDRLAVQVAKARVRKILEETVPEILAISDPNELLRQYLDRPKMRGWSGDGTSGKGGRHPAVLRALIKRARDLGVKLPSPSDPELLPADVRA